MRRIFSCFQNRKKNFFLKRLLRLFPLLTGVTFPWKQMRGTSMLEMFVCKVSVLSKILVFQASRLTEISVRARVSPGFRTTGANGSRVKNFLALAGMLILWTTTGTENSFVTLTLRTISAAVILPLALLSFTAAPGVSPSCSRRKWVLLSLTWRAPRSTWAW